MKTTDKFTSGGVTCTPDGSYGGCFCMDTLTGISDGGVGLTAAAVIGARSEVNSFRLY